MMMVMAMRQWWWWHGGDGDAGGDDGGGGDVGGGDNDGDDGDVSPHRVAQHRVQEAVEVAVLQPMYGNKCQGATWQGVHAVRSPANTCCVRPKVSAWPSVRAV